MTVFPLTKVMLLKRNILPLAISHGNWFWLYLFKGGVCMYLYRSWEPLQRCVARLEQTQALTRVWSASVAVSEPNCIADVCSVNCLSINGRGKPLYRTYEMFFGGYSTLKNYHMTFYIRHVTCKCENPVSTAGLRIINFLIIKYKIWIKTASFF